MMGLGWVANDDMEMECESSPSSVLNYEASIYKSFFTIHNRNYKFSNATKNPKTHQSEIINK